MYICDHRCFHKHKTLSKYPIKKLLCKTSRKTPLYSCAATWITEHHLVEKNKSENRSPKLLHIFRQAISYLPGFFKREVLQLLYAVLVKSSDPCWVLRLGSLSTIYAPSHTVVWSSIVT